MRAIKTILSTIFMLALVFLCVYMITVFWNIANFPQWLWVFIVVLGVLGAIVTIWLWIIYLVSLRSDGSEK